jgi:hypothetical protein
MTPSQKLIDAAAEALYEADRVNSKPWCICPWAEAPPNTKQDYLDLVTIPVAVALREAERMVTEHYQELSAEHRLLLINRAAAIASLIPQETQNAE